MSLEIRNVSKKFGAVAAVDDVSLKAKTGEFLALLGPSGSGKTTLLRMIAGLEFMDAGAIRFEDTDLSLVPARERRIGFVFQHYALFKHMTVARNISFGLDVLPWGRKPKRAAIEERVESLLARMQLEGLGGRYPTQLSGGQRQRVALARALAIEPRILLLDEPFGALDAKVRKELRAWLRALHDETKLTTVMVTHDQDEALALADRVAIMNQGRIEQLGNPRDLLDRPNSVFVREFLGGDGDGI
ncbi:MAG: sulfate ABC transporter ATP-binding protein [Alphaproteobacteria bacterium]|nr:sulfate ABC transporter ATP-binding protein [Alphaproteobacteria bacterium]